MHKKYRIYLLYCLFIIAFNGCADFISNNADDQTNSDNGISVSINFPATNDSVSVNGEEVNYTLKTSTGINFVELYINGSFVQNFQPQNSNKPQITFTLGTAYLNTRISLYLIYYDKNGSSIKSNESKNILVTDIPAKPQAPLNFSLLKITDYCYNLSWMDTSKSKASYEIWKKSGQNGEFVKYFECPENVYNVNDNNVTPDAIYFYKVRSVNVRGVSDFSSIISSTGGSGSSTIIPPSNLTAVATDINEVKLNWKDNSNNENYFKVERKSAYTVYSPIALLSPNTTTYTDSMNGLQANNTYYYRIKAISSNDSSWSGEVQVQTPEYVLKAPTLLSLSNPVSNKIKINWKDNDSRWANFEVFRKIDNGTYLKIGEVDGNIYTYTDENVEPNHYYYYKIRCNDGVYTSSYSNEINIYSNLISLATPANFTGYYSGQEIYLSWAYTNDPVKFVIERKQVNVNADFVYCTEVSGDSRSCQDANVQCQQTYIYRVKAIDNYNESNNSAEKSIKDWDSCR